MTVITQFAYAVIIFHCILCYRWLQADYDWAWSRSFVVCTQIAVLLLHGRSVVYIVVNLKQSVVSLVTSAEERQT